MESVLGVLAVAFVAGRLGAEAAERLRQPAVIGEIVAGVLIGPALLG
jgi:Kef-type K+ transport system membrane component KefB